MWPRGWHPGGLGWWLGRLAEPPAGVVVLRDGDRVVAWAGLSHADELTADLDPKAGDAVQAIVERLAAVPGALSIPVAGGQPAFVDALERAGFVADIAAPWIGLWLDATAERPQPVPGYRVRGVQPGETRARVDVHRAAWRPATLPYHPDHRPDVSPDATSNFTDDVYERVRATWLYDPDLDLVADAPDGSLAACCIGWYDPATGVTEIEPLGVHPDHRRRGLAGALCLEIAARTAERGGREVFINTGPRPDYPAPPAAYLKAGFREVRRGWTYRRP